MPGCYQQLTLVDRLLLHCLLDQTVAITEMACRLGRHRSMIYREIRRNTFHDRELSGYFGTIADQLTRERRRRLRKLPFGFASRRYPSIQGSMVS